ncbi:MAG: hypothetical protein IID45_11050 [Planctomycetes bacterium]|nr:hypothetical protein [Planctomycetota bacterium]
MTRHDRIVLHNWDGVTVLDLGEMDIWDGADLSLLRDTLTRIIEEEGCRSVGVSLRYVKYIPSGFFGMISDWHDKGISIHTYRPQPNVANMLWFRHFFKEVSDGCYVLLSEQNEELVAHQQAEADWHHARLNGETDAQWSESERGPVSAVQAE